MKNFLIIISLLTILASCNNKLRLDKRQINASDTSKTNYNLALQRAITTVSDSLDITNITKGVDSFEFHLWTPTKGKHYSLISIEYYNNSWIMAETYFKKHSAKRIKIDFSKPSFSDLLNDTTNDWTLEIPVTDDSIIAKIVDTLKQLDIANIPTQNQISGFNSQDIKGYRYIIEYSTKENYKFIEYINPNMFNDVYTRRISDLINLLRRYATDITY